tara:strand:+ start:113 stop:676 length:564 start_codon:yes stop_codon:yes gene_type:complete
MNNKNIFYSLVLIPILFSCTSTIYEQPSPKYSIIYDGKESNGNWTTENMDDPFSGKWIRSYVRGESSVRWRAAPELVVDYYPERRDYSIGVNWQEMICDWSDHNLKYVADDLPPFSISSFGYDVASNNNNVIWFKNYRGYEMKNHLIHIMNSADEIIFQIQSCGGNTSRASFNVTGQHHLTTSYLGE